jgi:hypothetical protein
MLLFGIVLKIVFFEKLKKFYLIFLNYFNILLSKIIFLKYILIYF